MAKVLLNGSKEVGAIGKAINQADKGDSVLVVHELPKHGSQSSRILVRSRTVYWKCPECRDGKVTLLNSVEDCRKCNGTGYIK